MPYANWVHNGGPSQDLKWLQEQVANSREQNHRLQLLEAENAALRQTVKWYEADYSPELGFPEDFRGFDLFGRN